MRNDKPSETLPPPKPKHGRSNPKKFDRNVLRPETARERMGLLYLTPAGVAKLGRTLEIKEREKGGGE